MESGDCRLVKLFPSLVSLCQIITAVELVYCLARKGKLRKVLDETQYQTGSFKTKVRPFTVIQVYALIDQVPLDDNDEFYQHLSSCSDLVSVDVQWLSASVLTTFTLYKFIWLLTRFTNIIRCF